MFLIFFTNTYFKHDESVCMDYEMSFQLCKPVNCYKTPEYVFENCFEVLGFKFSRALVVCVFYGLFVSMVAPFAGFFASGLKRAY